MEYNTEEKEIMLDRELSQLDEFVLDFIDLLDNYVIVFGYVSILLGRSRATEDIDLLIPEINKKEFELLWKKIHKKGFECINTSKVEDAFDMLKEHAIRFFKDIPIPNIEFKIIKNDLDKYSFDNKIKVILKQGDVYISPLELQICYKLFLGSEKDLEDAKHLYKLFEQKLNKEKLAYFIDKLKINSEFKIIDNWGEDEYRFRKIE